ncbi:aspartate aminotransferase [Haloprofundus marisrubri]|uniref:Aspartate aminotransferase n=1 Tax=Haloprofundus marisrubri TaxID=1514971 RepID=A0A0W1R889_9EURY|nr:pyridoxal phosphate-dependent aminotransferase [Haloprofundus marisrubri]KTG09737.1 aspartate aminotransferase [Haloprofundus marisrubri]
MDYEEPLFFRVMRYAEAADRDVVDMVSGNPDWEPPAALRDGLREFADFDADEFQYGPSAGLTELRGEIAERRNVDPSQIVVTNGAGEANYLAMARALERDAGDGVLLTDPVYPYYPGKAQMLGGDVTLVPVAEGGEIDVEAMREAATEETALIVANTPNNPTGVVYSRETMEALVSLAEEVDALLVADEVYDHFDYTGEFESALTIDSENRIVTSAFSKSMAITGFRVGYAIFPESLVDAAKTRHMLVNVAGSNPAQYAVLQALRETEPEYYEETRSMLSDRIAAFTDALDEAGADYTRPEGAFYVLARFDGFPGTMANVERLIDEAGVAGMPGEAFGPARADWIRFALVTPRAQEAAKRLADYF